MKIAAGARLRSCEVVAPLGTGGLGEVTSIVDFGFSAFS
jgi:hypothetical protein